MLTHSMFGIRLIKSEQVAEMWHVGLCTHQCYSALNLKLNKDSSRNRATKISHDKRDLTKGMPELLCSLSELTQGGNRCILMQRGCKFMCLVVALTLGNGG